MNTFDTITTIGNILTAVEKYGAPAVKRIIDELKDKSDPTLEEIEALGNIMKDPEDYFEEPGTGD